MDFRVLGAMEARDGHGPVDLGGGKAATLLAILLSQDGAVVTAAELIDQLWAGTPPPTAESALRVHLSRLRARLGSADGPLLRRRAGGYQLGVDRACVDAYTFEDLVVAGLGALRRGDDAGAWEALTAAVAVWHGPPYDGIDSPAVIPHTMRLEKLRLDAAEALASLRLERGEHGQVVTELAELVAAHPERERMASHLILALYRSGRQAESLAEFQRIRRWLDEELGLLPSPELTALEEAILLQKPELDWSPRGNAPRRAAHGSLDARLAALVDPPFVGREQLLAGIEHAITDRPARPGASLIVLEGPPGIGKTWAGAEVGRRLAGAGWDVAYGQFSATGFLPFEGWAELLRELEGRLDRDDLTRRLGDLGPALARIAPGVGGFHAAASSADESERLRLFAAVSTVLELAAVQRPQVLILDDVHWADGGSLSLLQYLIRRRQLAPVVIVALTRPADQGDAALWAEVLRQELRLPSGEMFVLHGLMEPEVRALVSAVAPHLADVADDDLRLLTDRFRGNPLQLCQVLRSTAIGDTGPAIAWTLAGLEPACLAALQTAACIGVEFDIALVGAVHDQSLEAVSTVLEAAVEARVLRESLSDHRRFAFGHSTFRDHVLDDADATHLAQIHLRLARALERLGASPPEIAYHAAASGTLLIPGELFAAHAGAATWLVERLSFEEASAHATAALSVAGNGTEVPITQRIQLQRLLGRCRVLLGDPEGARAAYDAGIDLCRVAGCHHELAEIAVEYDDYGRSMSAVGRRFELLSEALAVRDELPSTLALEVSAERVNEGFFHNRTQGPDEARVLRRLSVEVLAGARRVGDPRSLCAALNARHMALLAGPDVVQRSELSAEFVERAAVLGDPVYLGVAHQCRVHDLVQSSRFDEAEEELARYWSLVESCQLPRVRWLGLVMQSALRDHRGDADSATVVRHNALELGSFHGFPDALACDVGLRLAAGLRAGDTTGLLTEAAMLAEAAPIPEWVLVHGVALADSGHAGEAAARLDAFCAAMPTWPRNVFWQCSLAFASELAARVGATESSLSALRAELATFAGVHLVIGALVGVLAPAEQYLTLLRHCRTR